MSQNEALDEAMERVVHVNTVLFVARYSLMKDPEFMRRMSAPEMGTAWVDFIANLGRADYLVDQYEEAIRFAMSIPPPPLMILSRASIAHGTATLNPVTFFAGLLAAAIGTLIGSGREAELPDSVQAAHVALVSGLKALRDGMPPDFVQTFMGSDIWVAASYHELMANILGQSFASMSGMQSRALADLLGVPAGRFQAVNGVSVAATLITGLLGRMPSPPRCRELEEAYRTALKRVNSANVGTSIMLWNRMHSNFWNSAVAFVRCVLGRTGGDPPTGAAPA